MVRLLRIPLVLLFAALWAAGSYALGYLLLADRLDVALGAAFLGGVVTAGVMGGLTSRAWALLLGIPLAVGALTSSVYLAGLHHIEARPRLWVVVASARCVEPSAKGGGQGCGRHAYTFQDLQGRPVTLALDGEDAQGPARQVGAVLDVYLRDPATLKVWPEAMVTPAAGARTATRIMVPLFTGYVIAVGVAGTLSRLALQRRFRRHMLS